MSIFNIKNLKFSSIATQEEELSALETQKSQLESTQTEILNQKTELLAEISNNASENTKNIIEQYQQAQNDYETAKAELSTAKEKLDTAKAKKDIAKVAYENKKTELETINKIETTKQIEKAEKFSDEGEFEIPNFIPEDDAEKIHQLHPDMQEVMIEFFEKAKEAGLEFTLECGGQVRTLGEQENLKRTNPSRYGTPNPYGTSSLHLLGLAVDITPKECSYEELGEIGKSVGLYWGGDWTSGKEEWHFQLDSEIRLILEDSSIDNSEKEILINDNWPPIKKLSNGNSHPYNLSTFYTVEELQQKKYKI